MNRLVLVPLSRGQGNCTDTTFIPSEMRVVVHSDADEWKQIYEKEKATYTAKMSGSEHSTSNQREYFADCIEKYIVNHDELKEACPESFAYIEDILNKNIE